MKNKNLNQNKQIEIKELIKIILESSYRAQEGHIPSALSILDIVWTIYNQIINIKHIKKNSSLRDFFILSKGHGCLALYATLSKKNIISKKEMLNFCKFNGALGGHPNSLGVLGVEASTGSLGHGFPFAAGLALGQKILKKKNKVITLIGDGECNEGSVWETFLIGAHNNLDNLTCIIDYNKSGDRALKIDSLKDKIASFGWETEVIDGHNQLKIFDALKKKSKKPRAIIAQTTKGKYLKIMENNPEWHHKTLDKKNYQNLMKEINEKSIY